MKKIISVFFLFILSPIANSALIEHAGYSYDDTGNVVVGGGLEWLRWDVTDGQSIDQALSTFSSDGWRLANNVDMANLFNTFNFGMSFDTDENTGSYGWTEKTDDEGTDELDRIFFAMFGITVTNPGINPGDDPFEMSAAYFGDDADGDGKYNDARVVDDFVNKGTPSFGLAMISADVVTSSHAHTNMGIALVRTEGYSVDEPTTFWLFMFALVALYSANKRKKLVF